MRYTNDMIVAEIPAALRLPSMSVQLGAPFVVFKTLRLLRMRIRRSVLIAIPGAIAGVAGKLGLLAFFGGGGERTAPGRCDHCTGGDWSERSRGRAGVWMGTSIRESCRSVFSRVSTRIAVY